MAKELLLGETVLRRGGTTDVPRRVTEALGIEPKRNERSKLLWTPAGGEVVVSKATPQSDWRKTMLRRNGTAAIPRHVQQALGLNATSANERVSWVKKGDRIVIMKAKGPQSSSRELSAPGPC